MTALRPCAAPLSAAAFAGRVARSGAIIEKVIGDGRSGHLAYPSALGHLRRDSTLGTTVATLLAVHDQVIGAAGGYEGCRFPADPRYRRSVADAAIRVLRELIALGVSGHVGIDFISDLSSAGSSEIYATEINLRQTGTTHPHCAVRAIIPRTWTDAGTLIDQTGREICYHATDGLISSRYVGISTTSLIERIRQSPLLRFDPIAGRGAVPHLWPALERCGKVGATFIGRSHTECENVARALTALLDELSQSPGRRP
jgi:hypothetical protein